MKTPEIKAVFYEVYLALRDLEERIEAAGIRATYNPPELNPIERLRAELDLPESPRKIKVAR